MFQWLYKSSQTIGKNFDQGKIPAVYVLTLQKMRNFIESVNRRPDFFLFVLATKYKKKDTSINAMNLTYGLIKTKEFLEK